MRRSSGLAPNSSEAHRAGVRKPRLRRRFAAAGLLRRLDLASRFALGAASEALAAARLPGLVASNRIGVSAGTMTSGMSSVRDFLDGLLSEGLEGASPMLFPFTLPNAASGQDNRH